MSSIQEQYIQLKRALFDKYYAFLNDEQRKAVFSVNGHLLVLAGAGSGKTTVLVNRVGFIIKYGNAYFSEYAPADIDQSKIEALRGALTLPREQLALVLNEFSEHPCPPWNVLAITFTKKAAEEIRQRLSATLGEGIDASDIWAGTFHSVCVRIIRRYADFIGYGSDFSIYDTDNTKSVLKDVMKELRIEEKSMPIKNVRTEISRAKNALMTPELHALDVRGDYRREKIAQIYEKYQARLKECNALDFDDIIMEAVNILSNCDEAREYYGNKFRYVAVDEFQDTNAAQLKLTELLGSVHGNIMVVGDDDQSIYKFRGAVVENIIGFGKQKGTKVIRLERNYRSTSCILDAANAVISQNSTRMGKKLFTERNDSSRLTLHRSETQKSEAVYICEQINRLVVSEKYKYRDIAVLYRLNAISNSIESTMSASGIPHVTLSGQSFYERMEIKDILAYLYVSVNPSDRERLKRIINVPKRSIGAKTVEALFIIASEQGVNPIDIMRHADSYAALSRSAPKLKDFARLIDGYTTLLYGDISLEEFVVRVLDTSGYRQSLVDAGEEEKERLNNLDELVSSIRDFENEYRASATMVSTERDSFGAVAEPAAFDVLSAFLERCSLVADVDKYDESADAVVLMTVHSAKGLEFPVVFLPAMEEGVFPGTQNINSVNLEDMEEERRLAYVALTRAKDKIYITHTRNRMLYNQTSYNPLSRFIREIPENLINDETEEYDTYAYMPRQQAVPKTYFSVRDDSARAQQQPTPQRTAPKPTAMLKEGDRVRHRVFGEGEIFSVKPMGADVLYEVVFDTAGTKKLMGSFAKLVKIK